MIVFVLRRQGRLEHRIANDEVIRGLDTSVSVSAGCMEPSDRDRTLQTFRRSLYRMFPKENPGRFPGQSQRQQSHVKGVCVCGGVCVCVCYNGDEMV